MSGWSRGRAGTPRQRCACEPGRSTTLKRSPAGSGAGAARPGEADPVAGPEGLRDEPDGVLVRQVACQGHDRVGRPVGIAPEAADGVRRQAAHRRLVAGDLPAERRVAEERLVEDVEDELPGVVAVGADLLDDDLALAVDLVVGQQRPDDQLGQDVHGTGRLADRQPAPVDGRLAIGGGVARAADALDGLGDEARRRVGLGALEGDVLHEVGDAGLLTGLAARASQDVGRHGEGAGARQTGGDHPRPVGQDGALEHRADGTGIVRRH